MAIDEIDERLTQTKQCMEKRGVGAGRCEIEALVQRIRQSGPHRRAPSTNVTNVVIKVGGSNAKQPAATPIT